MTITLRPDLAARCWLATFPEGCTVFPPGTFPLPYAVDAPVQAVAAFVRERFPGHRVTGVQAVCVGCGE